MPPSTAPVSRSAASQALTGPSRRVPGWCRRLSVVFALVLAATLGAAAPAQAQTTITTYGNGFESHQPSWTFVTWQTGFAGRSSSSAHVRSGSWGATLYGGYPFFGTGGLEARHNVSMPTTPILCSMRIFIKNWNAPTTVRLQIRTTGGVPLKTVHYYLPTNLDWFAMTTNYTPVSRTSQISVTLLPETGTTTLSQVSLDDLQVTCLR